MGVRGASDAGWARAVRALALLVVLCTPVAVLAWQAAPVDSRQEIEVSVHSDAASTDGRRLRLRGDEEKGVRAELEFVLPAAGEERWVLWLSRDAFDEVRVSAPGWTPPGARFFRPDARDGLLPAGYGFALPKQWSGPRRVEMVVRGGVRSAPTPRVLSEREVLNLSARSSAMSYAVYAALLTLVVTALALYSAVRDRAFLLFATYTGMALLFTGTVNGHLYGMPMLGLLGGLGAAGFWATLLLFSGLGVHMLAHYGDVASPMARPAWRRWLPWVLMALGGLALLPSPAWAGLRQLAGSLGWALALLAAATIACGAARRGVSMAVAVLLALLLLALGTGAHEAMQRGLVDDGLWVRFGYQVALALLSLMIFVGLSSRIGEVRQRLDQETLALQRSESRLRHERIRAALAQSLRERLRDLPADQLAAQAFRHLCDAAAELLPGVQAVAISQGYQGHDLLLAQGEGVQSGVAPSLLTARATLRMHTREHYPTQLRLDGPSASDNPQAPLFAVLPLPLESPAWGVLALHDATRAGYGDVELAACAELARLAVVHADEAWIGLQLRRTAEHDELTGTLNRRSLDQSLLRESQRTAAMGAPLSLLFLDVDRFKRINDEHGHACGDHCLRSIAANLRAELEAGDTLGRYGGEEFLVLLPGRNAAAARIVAERLRRAVEQGVVHWQGERMQLTVSIGMATSRDGVIARLLERADQALYAAKHGGRNQVAVGSGEP